MMIIMMMMMMIMMMMQYSLVVCIGSTASACDLFPSKPT
jgi:hypothetical protein